METGNPHMTPDPRLSYTGYTQQQSEPCRMYGGCVLTCCCTFLRLSVSRRSGCCLVCCCCCWGWYLARKSGEDCGVWLADCPGDSAGSGGVPADRSFSSFHLQATGRPD